MQKFILSVIPALRELLRVPTRLLWNVFSIFFGRKKRSPQIPPLDPYSPSDSPYEPPSEKVWHIWHQTSVPSRHSTVNEIPLRRTPSPIHTPSTPDASAVGYTQPPRPATISTVAALEVIAAPEVIATPEFIATPEIVVAPEFAATPEVVPEAAVATEVIDSLSYETPESLRHKARSEGDLKAEYFSQSRAAFANGKKRLAKELSLKGEIHNENMLRFDKEASARIFRENNQNAEPNTVDLHRLYVAEAEHYFKKAVQNDWDSSTGPLCVIVGKGNHSDDGIPKIKPAIQDLGESLKLTVVIDRENDGRLIVNDTEARYHK